MCNLIIQRVLFYVMPSHTDKAYKNLRTYIWIYMMNDDDQLQNHYLKVMRMVRLKCQNQRQLQPGRLGAERGSPVDASAKVWTCHGLGM